MGGVTRILHRAEEGDPHAAADLLPLVYSELRRLAASRLAGEAAGHTLQPTALVHEAWLRLVEPGDQTWAGRGHFFAAAAEAMRRILVDQARRRLAARRGGGQERVPLEEDRLPAAMPPDELLAVHEALDALAACDPSAAELIKLRFFVGLTLPEAAETLQIPVRSAERLWSWARAWLRRAVVADAGKKSSK